MIVVIMNHNFKQETKVFDFLCEAQDWADRSGYTLVPTSTPNVYRAEF